MVHVENLYQVFVIRWLKAEDGWENEVLRDCLNANRKEMSIN